MIENALARQNTDLPASLDALADAVRGYVNASISDNTRKAYTTDFAVFDVWCRSYGVSSLPADAGTVAAYIAGMAGEGKKAATITRALASIAEVHKAKGHPSPIDPRVKIVAKGIRNKIGTKQDRARPILPADLKIMVQQIGDDLQGTRDRAMVLLGFAGAFRRSELVGLNRDDVKAVREGLEVTVRRSKTDQEGQGRTVAVPYGSHHDTCPVRAMMDWLAVLDVQHPAGGALFRPVKHTMVEPIRASDKAVDRLVKRLAIAASLPEVSAHSLRAGLATAAYLSGKSDRAIMQQGRWTSTASVNRYIRDGKLWKDDNAAGGIGL